MHYGELPIKMVDHINRDRDNNCISNLREATPSQNLRNGEKRKGASKHRGVSPSRGKWKASISTNRTKHFIGRFINEDAAGMAYDLAAFFFHVNTFAILNFPDNENWYKKTVLDLDHKSQICQAVRKYLEAEG